jgi:hypothetical protein
MSDRAILTDDSLLSRIQQAEDRIRVLERGGTNRVDHFEFSPLWTGVTGNGALLGNYTFIGGSIMYLEIHLLWGSTTSHPATSITFTTNTADFTVMDVQPYHPINALAYDDSADRWYSGNARVGYLVDQVYAVDGTVAIVLSFGTNVQLANNTIPFTWGQNDELSISGIIRATGPT